MSKRDYQSPTRTEQAEKTKLAILRAAQKLFVQKGYDATTIDAIAKAAKVSAPTVYAVFKSKRGVIAALLDHSRFGPEYQELVDAAANATDVHDRLAYAGRIARHIYERENPLFANGFAAISPDLADMERGKEETRFERQVAQVEALQKTKRLRKGLTAARARDILWALTSRQIYRALVQDKGWTPDAYERWLNTLLTRELIEPDA